MSENKNPVTPPTAGSRAEQNQEWRRRNPGLARLADDFTQRLLKHLDETLPAHPDQQKKEPA